MSPLLKSFVGTRMAIGVVSWVAPSFAARIFGLDPARQPIIPQLFGAREFALGFVTAASTGTTRKQALRLGVMIDTADAVATFRGMRKGLYSTQAKILVGAGAGLFAAIGATALAQEDDPETSPGR